MLETQRYRPGTLDFHRNTEGPISPLYIFTRTYWSSVVKEAYIGPSCSSISFSDIEKLLTKGSLANKHDQFSEHALSLLFLGQVGIGIKLREYPGKS